MVQSINDLLLFADASQQAYDHTPASTIVRGGDSYATVYPEVVNGGGVYSPGFSAAAHMSASGELIISFGGTEGSLTGPDWRNNFTQIGLGGTGLQPNDALTYALTVIDEERAFVRHWSEDNGERAGTREPRAEAGQ